MTRVSINYLEQGRHQARISTLEAVAGVLGVSVGQLTGRVPLHDVAGMTPPGGEPPEVTLEVVYRVRCAVCGVVEESADVEVAAREWRGHPLLHGAAGHAAGGMPEVD